MREGLGRPCFVQSFRKLPANACFFLLLLFFYFDHSFTLLQFYIHRIG